MAGKSSSVHTKSTPSMRQFHQIKQSFPEGILFFRMGDFYEMFEEDAVSASKVLEIALTKRNGIPMCGIPYHAKDNYLPKLLKAGYKVAICDQMEDSSKAKGIVRREIVEILTPGTLTDGKLLDVQNNFLFGFCIDGKILSIAAADISTGDFYVLHDEYDFPYAALRDELIKFSPNEVILPESLASDEFIAKVFTSSDRQILQTIVDDYYFNSERGEAILQNLFEVATLKGFGLDKKPLAIGSCGAVINYLKRNMQRDPSHITSLKFITRDQYLYMSESTIRNLELFSSLQDSSRQYTLYKCIQKTRTAMGHRLLANYLTRPCMDINEIQSRQDIVQFFTSEKNLLADVREKLNGISDIERLVSRITLGKITTRDIINLRDSLAQSLELAKNLRFHSELKSFTSGFFNPDELISKITETINDDPSIDFDKPDIIKEGVSSELDEIRHIGKHSKNLILKLQERERQATGISSLKVGYNKVVGYYLEVTKPNLKYIPAHYQKKQTLVSNERFTIGELIELETKITGAQEKIAAFQKEIFDNLCTFLIEYTEQMQDIAARIAKLDVLTGFADLAITYGYIRPVVDMSDEISIRKGRHPVVEANLLDETFIPNDLNLDDENARLIIVTGPNMSGKSTYLRQNALIVILAQMGSFVPAEHAKIGLVDKIFTRIGASDNLARGESTFLVEMTEAAEILNNATSRSLIIMDEIGRGTSTYDGLSLAWSIVEFLAATEKNMGKTIFATHYHELSALSNEPGIKCYQVLVKEFGKQIVFLHEVVEGSANRSYGIQVARLAGISDEIIDRAQEILNELENRDFALEEKAIEKTQEKIIEDTQGQFSLFGDYSELRQRIMKINVDKSGNEEAVRLIRKLQHHIRTGQV